MLNSTIELHVSTIYSQEKALELKKEKSKLSDDLNSLKQTKRKVNLDAQIAEELTADLQVFLYTLTHYNNSIDDYIRNDYALREIYHRIGIKQNALHEEKIAAVEQHNRFLVSSYHHNLPYKWIRSVLWAHLMQRQNIIRPSDHNDIIWAAAYLPFVDYAVTDIAFCNLLYESNLATQYGTRVFSFPSLRALIDAIKQKR